MQQAKKHLWRLHFNLIDYGYRRSLLLLHKRNPRCCLPWAPRQARCVSSHVSFFLSVWPLVRLSVLLMCEAYLLGSVCLFLSVCLSVCLGVCLRNGLQAKSELSASCLRRACVCKVHPCSESHVNMMFYPLCIGLRTCLVYVCMYVCMYVYVCHAHRHGLHMYTHIFYIPTYIIYTYIEKHKSGRDMAVLRHTHVHKYIHTYIHT